MKIIGFFKLLTIFGKKSSMAVLNELKIGFRLRVLNILLPAFKLSRENDQAKNICEKVVVG